MATECWSCHRTHPTDGQTCTEARHERLHLLLEAVKQEIQAIPKCVHDKKSPARNCRECTKQVDA